MSGTSSFAMNYLMQQQQNAYELQLWNMANEYNSPAMQMDRFREAGLNPNLAYTQMSNVSPASSSQPIPAKPTNFDQENKIRKMQALNQMLGETVKAIGTIKDLYDYGKYGTTEHGLKNSLLGLQGDALRASNAFKQYVQYPYLSSKYGNTEESVTLPDGTVVTYNYANTLEGAEKIARTRTAQGQKAIQDFMLNNIYPEQVKRYKMANYGNEAIMRAFDSITSRFGVTQKDNPILWALVWNLVNGDIFEDFHGILSGVGNFF